MLNIVPVKGEGLDKSKIWHRMHTHEPVPTDTEQVMCCVVNGVQENMEKCKNAESKSAGVLIKPNLNRLKVSMICPAS